MGDLDIEIDSDELDGIADRVARRLRNLLARPLMWAATREAYVAQLSTMLDMLGYDGHSLYEAMWTPGSAAIQEPGAPLDEGWAASLGGRVKLIIHRGPASQGNDRD